VSDPFQGAVPQHTFVAVIGIERYDRGEEWDLDGPAHDAKRFVEWALARNVPPANITAFVRPLEKNEGISTDLAALGINIEYPDNNSISDYFATNLPGDAAALAEAEGSLLVILWGGHGVIGDGFDRRLFFANTNQTYRRNLSFSAFVRLLGSETYVRLRRQVLLVDACANYVEQFGWLVTAPPEAYPYGQPSVDVVQAIFYASVAGETAENIHRSGRFSETVIGALEGYGVAAFPGDVAAVFSHVEARFEEMRASGETSQKPVQYLIDAQRAFRRQKDAGTIPLDRSGAQSATKWFLSVERLRSLAEDVAQRPAAAAKVGRVGIAAALWSQAGVATNRNDDPVHDTLELLLATLRMTDSFDCFFNALALYDAEPITVLGLRSRAASLLATASARSALSKVDVPFNKLRRLYLASVPDLQKVPAADTIDLLVEGLASLERHDGASPLEEFMQRLHDAHEHAAVGAWLDRLDGPTRAAVRTRIERLAQARDYLTVLVARDVDVLGLSPMKAWLWDDGTFRVKRSWPDKDDVADDDDEVAFDRIFNEARTSCAGALGVEFLVARANFSDGPDTWHVSNEFSGRESLRSNSPVVMRWRERLLKPDASRRLAWERLSERIQTRGGAARVCWIDSNAFTFQQLRNEVQLHCDEWDVIAFAFSLPSAPAQKDDLIMAALLGGAPFVVHTQSEPDDWNAYRRAVEDALSVGIRDAPIEFFKRHLGHACPTVNASLLWDNATHHPLLDQLSRPERT
jgi:hypothetical protein